MCAIMVVSFRFYLIIHRYFGMSNIRMTDIDYMGGFRSKKILFECQQLENIYLLAENCQLVSVCVFTTLTNLQKFRVFPLLIFTLFLATLDEEL